MSVVEEKYTEREVDPNDGLCHERAESLIPRWGMSFSCVLPKGHEGEHKGGGSCVIHGPYIGIHGCSTCSETGYAEIFERDHGRKPNADELWDGKPKLIPWNGETTTSFAEAFKSNLEKLDYDKDLTSGPVIDVSLEEKEETLLGTTAKSHMTQRDLYLYRVDKSVEKAMEFMGNNEISEELRNVITNLISSINGLQEIILSS